jgi:hypothetical protein
MPAPRRRKTTAGDRELAGPPAPFTPVDARLYRLPSGAALVRIYAPFPYGTRPTTFRDVGPLNRFDHHRPDHLDSRGRDRGRGILYAAATMTCCAGEYFGDGAAITRHGNRVARIDVTSHLELIDLRGPAATGVGTAPAISGVTQRATTQAWARWLYDHPDLRQADGIIYSAFHSSLDAVALWERARRKVVCPRGKSWALEAAAVEPDLAIAAAALHLPILD